jgi:sec-independent protein translocase protein TatA
MPVLHPDLAIFDIGGTEILIIMVAVLLLFGTERLPDLARSMGRTLREFKKVTSGLEEELKRALETPPPARPPAKKTPDQPVPPNPAPVPPAVAPPPAAPPPPPEDFPYP